MNINTLRAEYNIHDSIRIVICFGSVVNFGYPTNPDKSAIVNAANNLCLGGGGVDGAISTAGGERLLNDRRALPSIRGHGREVRCKTGDAVITGPNQYGQLLTPFVIHAVGPNYSVPKYRNNMKKGDSKLHNAYKKSLMLARQHGVEAIAFSLISSGAFLGDNSVHRVGNIAMRTIVECDYEELREVHFCAHDQNEFLSLIEVAYSLGLSRE